MNILNIFKQFKNNILNYKLKINNILKRINNNNNNFIIKKEQFF